MMVNTQRRRRPGSSAAPGAHRPGHPPDMCGQCPGTVLLWKLHLPRGAWCHALQETAPRGSEATGLGGYAWSDKPQTSPHRGICSDGAAAQGPWRREKAAQHADQSLRPYLRCSPPSPGCILQMDGTYSDHIHANPDPKVLSS